MTECLINLDYNLIIAFSSAVTAVFSGAVFFIYHKQLETQKKQLQRDLVADYRLIYPKVSEACSLITGGGEKNAYKACDLLREVLSDVEIYYPPDVIDCVTQLMNDAIDLGRLTAEREHKNLADHELKDIRPFK